MIEFLFVIVPIIVISMFIFTFAMILSPKLRGKFMSHQIKATKYMLDDSKDTLEDIAATVGGVGARSRKKILDQNEDILRESETREANISKDAIAIKMRAIRDGLQKDEMYCKHCGEAIDKDSTFCKYCGKEQ